MQRTGYPASIDLQRIVFKADHRQIMIIDDHALDKLTYAAVVLVFASSDRKIVWKIEYEYPLQTLRPCRKRKTARNRSDEIARGEAAYSHLHRCKTPPDRPRTDRRFAYSSMWIKVGLVFP